MARCPQPGCVCPLNTATTLLWRRYGDFHRDVLVQPHRHLVLAQLPDGIVQLNLAAVDVVVLRGQSFSDILARHRAEQLIVLAGLLRDPDGRPGHDLGQILRPRPEPWLPCGDAPGVPAPRSSCWIRWPPRPCCFGSRKLRAYPGATLTTCPRVPNFSMSSLRMTSIFPPA